MFFLQGLPNGPGVPTKMSTDQIHPAITMATDARVKTTQGSTKKHTQTSKQKRNPTLNVLLVSLFSSMFEVQLTR